jgi:hypothetical protein
MLVELIWWQFGRNLIFLRITHDAVEAVLALKFDHGGPTTGMINVPNNQLQMTLALTRTCVVS